MILFQFLERAPNIVSVLCKLLTERTTQNLMKGYISRERAIVVLSKGGTAFPGTGV